MTGAPRPTVASSSAQVLRGRGVRYRSYCRSDRRLISPAPISAATVATDDGSNHPSCRRRSSALSRSALGSLPYGMSSRAAYPRSISPGSDRIDRVAPPVRREVGAGELEHAGVIPLGIEMGGVFGPVVGQLLGTLQVVGHHLPREERWQVDDGDGNGRRRGDEPDLRTPPRQRADAGAQHHREREDDQRHGARRRAEGEPEVEAGEAGEQRPVGRRIVVRMRPDRDQRADREHGDEVTAFLPLHGAGREQRADAEEVSHADQPQMLRVGDARLDPGPELVVAVEEPVAETAQQLGARRAPSPRSRRSPCTAGSGCRSDPGPTARRSTTAKRRV